VTFISLAFLLFVPVVFALHWTVPDRRSRNWILLFASYVFYGWWDARFCALILISSVIDFSVGLALGRVSDGRHRRILLGVSLAFNLGMLGLFKYFHFFVDSAVQLAEAVGWRFAPVDLQILLPIGISFYTFQTLSYTIDVYRGALNPTRDFVAYMAYVSFFPQLVAGPIERGTRLLPQFLKNRRFCPAAARDGLRQMLWGFVKKMVIADRLAVLVDGAYAQPELASGGALAVATLCFAFQVYCDFSAYSDIAIGTGKLFGIDLMRNFAYPFFAQSFRELWRRWHISLITWLRDYLYIPLGGSRAGRWATIRNIMVTFTLAGLWHGAAWHFVVFGALCGAIIALEMVMGGGRPVGTLEEVPGGLRAIPPLRVLWRMVRTTGLFASSMLLFRAESLSDSALMAKKIVLGAGGLSMVAAQDVVIGALLITGMLVVEWSGRAHHHPVQIGWLPKPVRWAFYTGAIWLTLMFMADDRLAFIYFQF